MWMTPFSGPSQRSCESPASSRQNAAEIGGEVLERSADDVMTEGFDCGGANLVAAPNRKRQPVAFEAAVGLENHVRGGVIGIGVHGIGADRPLATSEIGDPGLRDR